LLAVFLVSPVLLASDVLLVSDFAGVAVVSFFSPLFYGFSFFADSL
jgi:hypothetical protein